MNMILNIISFPLFMIYLSVIAIRNFLYDIKLFKTTKLPCKIISIGNITIGGTGKTPTVIAIAKFLQQQNKTVAVLSRGYGRESTGTQLVTDGKTILTDWKISGDEPMLMAKRFSGIPIVVDENRIRGGKYLINKFNPEIIILDDGFQHRKIYRDIDIVLVNSNMSKFKNRVIGFRNFREPWGSLKRVHLLLLTKGDIVTPSNKLMARLNTVDFPLFKANIISSSYLLDNKNNKLGLDYFNRKKALLFSGVGDPESFQKTVQSLNIHILDSINFRDHKNYSPSDIQKIRDKFNMTGADVILTTEKDFLKIAEINLPIYSIPINMNVDKKGFKQILKHLN